MNCYLSLAEKWRKSCEDFRTSPNYSESIPPIFGGKTDIQSAFRLIPLEKWCWKWLIMKARDPKTEKWKFFVDKCLPFRASISCTIFQEFSDALKFLIEYRTKAPDSVANYLDDFLFLAFTIMMRNFLISEILLRVPIALEKTEWADESACIIFLRILLDGKRLILRVPLEKRVKALNMLRFIIVKKKATVKQLQELCGYLNFLCKAIFSGKDFHLSHVHQIQQGDANPNDQRQEVSNRNGTGNKKQWSVQIKSISPREIRRRIQSRLPRCGLNFLTMMDHCKIL